MARSKFEDAIIKDYTERGLDVSYEPMVLEAFVSWNYKPDFVLTTKSGKFIIIEAKGDLKYFNTDYRKKWLSMYRNFSSKHDIRIIFQHDKLLPRSKRITTTKWAEKHGIKYHVGDSIPQTWIDE